MRRRVKIFIGAAAITVIISGVFLTGYLMSVQNYRTAVAQITYTHSDALSIPDGVYIGECDVRFIYAKVEVTVKDRRIADIRLLEHRHDRGIQAERILQEIIVQQKMDVDIVAGATNSSKVLKKAVDNALSGASR